MNHYGVREVEKLLGLPRSTIRALVEAGFVSPRRGPRRAWLFSFQDLIVLRTAQALASSDIPRKRITRSMRELRRLLPEAMPLSGLRISAVGDRVAVREGNRQWQADSGQYLLAFDGDPSAGTLSVVEAPARQQESAQAWFDRAVELDGENDEAAAAAYAQAIALDPSLLDAHVNLGCLLHESGRLPQAELAYREGLAACGRDAGLLFNLGVLLEQLGRKEEAMEVYLEAVALDARLADCHYNLALLCQDLDRPKDAIRHMAQYRRLTGRK